MVGKWCASATAGECQPYTWALLRGSFLLLVALIPSFYLPGTTIPPRGLRYRRKHAISKDSHRRISQQNLVFAKRFRVWHANKAIHIVKGCFIYPSLPGYLNLELLWYFIWTDPMFEAWNGSSSDWLLQIPKTETSRTGHVRKSIASPIIHRDTFARTPPIRRQAWALSNIFSSIDNEQSP